MRTSYLLGILTLVACDSQPPAPQPTKPHGESASSTRPAALASASSSASASTDPAANSMVPMHAAPPQSAHAVTAQPPPPSPKRQAPAKSTKHDSIEVIVSDVTLAPGAKSEVSIELRPTTSWKLNTDYPVKVVLSGLAFSVTPELTLRSKGAGAKLFKLTSGGFRIDIPFSGDSPGEDEVTADMRLGLCSEQSCETRQVEAHFKVHVTTP